MNFYYEPTAYNFNPRQGPKELKLRFLIKTGIMKRDSIPLGKDLEHKKYKTACRNAYLEYHKCLQINYFDRAICRQFQKEVITCEHRQGLYQSNEAILTRLRTGLQVCKARREQINKRHEERYNLKKGKAVIQETGASQTEFETTEDAKKMADFLKQERETERIEANAKSTLQVDD